MQPRFIITIVALCLLSQVALANPQDPPPGDWSCFSSGGTTPIATCSINHPNSAFIHPASWPHSKLKPTTPGTWVITDSNGAHTDYSVVFNHVQEPDGTWTWRWELWVWELDPSGAVSQRLVDNGRMYPLNP